MKRFISSAFLTLFLVGFGIYIIAVVIPSSYIKIILPYSHTVYPPEFPSPLFQWEARKLKLNNWKVELKTNDGNYRYDTILMQTTWRPDSALWNRIKAHAIQNQLSVTFSVNRYGSFATRRVSFSFSTDSVDAPILFRQLPIPFVFAERYLDSMNYILVNIGHDGPPHVAMPSFPVCGNCHSFTQNGEEIGLDLDAGLRDKGGYFITKISDTMYFDKNNYMSWTSIEKRRTFGLFSKLSPDGRYIVTTVKDRIIHKNFPYEPQHMAFSQLFFPINGKLAVYDRVTHKLKELPGANLDEYVHSNATWTPDGEYIIFCRAPALPYGEDTTEINIRDEQLIEEYVERKRGLKFDICIIPFNNGNGGTAIPIKGASQNGKSNYFPAVSPDGKWIVFCQAENFMLLQPDSKLYIVPIEGGKARELECNLSLLNSWHAWSPNGKWITFVSKGLSIFTDLFIAHIDEKGHASPPVLVDRVRKNRRVVNYPEFVNIPAGKTFNMVYQYVELIHIKKAIDDNNINEAKKLYYQWKQQNHTFFWDEDLKLLWQMLGTMKLPKEQEWVEQLRLELKKSRT